MQNFIIDGAKAFMRPWKPKESTLEGVGVKGKAAKVTKVELTIEVDTRDVDIWKSLDVLWPGLTHVAKAVAGEAGCDGFDTTSRKRLPQMHVSLFPDEGCEKADFEFPLAEPTGKPRFAMSGDGEGKLTIKVLVSVRRSHLPKLSDYLDADVWLGLEPAQPDLTDMEPDNVVVMKKAER